MSDYDDDSVTNNLRDSANGTFVTLDDYLLLTFPEDATFEEPELACMLENLQKGRKGSSKGFQKARKERLEQG